MQPEANSVDSVNSVESPFSIDLNEYCVDEKQNPNQIIDCRIFIPHHNDLKLLPFQ